MKFILHRARITFLALLAALAAGLAQAQNYEGTDPATGYRIGEYRGKTPASVPGAAAVDSAAAQKLHGEGVAFIDVWGVPGVEPDPLSGAWEFGTPHETIPGSRWVPNIGTGTLNISMDGYFREQLAKAAGPPPGRPVVFFCQRDCWMSWNAAKRAASWGYKLVYWYADGTDGWKDSGAPLAPAAAPEPVEMD